MRIEHLRQGQRELVASEDAGADADTDEDPKASSPGRQVPVVPIKSTSNFP